MDTHTEAEDIPKAERGMSIPEPENIGGDNTPIIRGGV